MLSTNLITFTFKKAAKSGFYIDYAFRCAVGRGLRNGAVWGALYVSEKFMIEYLTRFTANTYTTSFTREISPLHTLRITGQWVYVILIVWGLV